MLEKGRLYSLKKDGAKDSLYLNIKNKRFLFGSAEYCTVRLYIDGIFPEHCVLSIGGQGKAYLEPLHPSALTFVNGIKIKHKVCLQDNDVVAILRKEFQFSYSPNCLSRNVSFERPILPDSKQVKPAQNIEMLAPEKNWETSQPFTESSVSKANCILKKQICIISNDIRKISDFLLKFTVQELVNIECEKINYQEVNSCSDKFVIKYNQYFKESPEERRNLALKFYEFIGFLRGLLSRNKENLYVLWPIFESVWKYCIARVSKDILFLPIKSLNLNGEVTVNKKDFQSRILLCTSKNLLPVSSMSEKENQCKSSLKVSVLSNAKTDGWKQNQYSSRKISTSYKKRVSLAVKRYHLRKRKSTIVAKTIETLELSGERPHTTDMCREISSGEQDVVFCSEKQQTTGRKRKRLYNKKEKEVLTDKENLKTTLKEEMEQNIISETNGIKSKKRNYERKNKTPLEKTGKSTLECNTLEVSRFQRITRSMAKSRH